MKYRMFKNPICNAPFVSMYFRPDGSVTPCCFNSEYIYGKYPEKSVKQIWEGKERKALQKAMFNNDLSHGCQICNRHIINNNAEIAGLNQYKHLNINKTPSKLEFELSHQCNLNCIMCFQLDENRNLCVYDDNFVDQLSSYLQHAEFLSFTGGEPFINELYFQIWDIVTKSNPSCINIIQTNGTIWNNRIKNLLENGRFQISISLDSIDATTYEQIRVNAKLENTLKNSNNFMKSMMKHGDNLIINVCPMRNNAYNITDIIKFTTSINSKIYFNTVYSPPNLSLINLSLEKLELILQHYYIFLNERPHISEQNKISFLGLINQIKSFIENWEISEEKMKYNKHYAKSFQTLIEKISINTSIEEKKILELKLNSIFENKLSDFPVVYGINLLLKKNNLELNADWILKNNSKYIWGYFMCSTLSSIRQ
ncbi:MAG: SPASM domain-containing protein [Bacteroidales bacterium]|nr:SPASM domain-containing protein [Bacteroidales bacterium]